MWYDSIQIGAAMDVNGGEISANDAEDIMNHDWQ